MTSVAAQSQGGGAGLESGAVDEPNETLGEAALAFGPFRLFRSRRVLAEGEAPVRLSDRALDILIALVERAGEVVTKRELMALVWPDTFVEESNLRVHVAALRRLLGEGRDGQRYILNNPGRGYVFIGQVQRLAGASLHPPMVNLPRGLPPRQGRLIGREAVLDDLVVQTAVRRFVTITGPGGVGKSSLAVALVERWLQTSSARAVFVELAAVRDPTQMAATLATTLGVSAHADDPLASLTTYIGDEDFILVFDNCEHLLLAVATVAERLLRSAPRLKILATSREPIRGDGEWVYRLAALETPPTWQDLDAKMARDYPAVQLFLERAAASVESLTPDEEDVLAAAEVCRRLDGLPLAIELAAARVDIFSVPGLLKALDERLMLSTPGRRTADPRQQSLQATMDWSHSLLSTRERVVLRRLSIFRGSFLLQSAAAVVSEPGLTPNAVLEDLMALANKSLIVADPSGPSILYRLLHMTRAYAEERLDEEGETDVLARRHAQHFKSLLSEAQGRWDTMGRADWLAEYGHTVEDVRGALEWSFGPQGDVAVGAALTASSFPFGYQLSLIDEFKRRIQVALGELAKASPSQLISEVRLTAALCALNLNTVVDPVELKETFDRVTSLCARLEDPRHKVEPLLKEGLYLLEQGDYAGAAARSDYVSSIVRAADDPLAILLADRTAAQIHHHAGDQVRARQLAERVLRHPAKGIPMTYAQTAVDRRVSMRIILARVLWLEGSAEEAAGVAAEALRLAEQDGAFAVSQALALGACPISLWNGDLEIAEDHIALLVEYARRYALDRWRRLGEAYGASLLALRGSPPVLRPEPAGLMQDELLTTIDPSWVNERLVARARAGLSGWAGPEILRAEGVRLARAGDPQGARAQFQFALLAARAAGAKGWERRASASLHDLLRDDETGASPALI
ncbi:ATP-binding protein [Caulobacter segnis]|uniref:ATP-binding protein n=1 Tax=Caulobacter segnis TaxID=88688 RepID=UPI001CBD9A67|nr:winged helix-turn-helix domain-containing protein [Caulobacter segnis]UAL10199.1 helix-turn-helix transcriptional regulator [Caulobacter segnis]